MSEVVLPSFKRRERADKKLKKEHSEVVAPPGE